MNGFSVPLDIYAEASDPDVFGLDHQKENIICSWKCLNLNFGSDCKTMDGDPLNVESIEILEIHVEKKRL